MSEALKIIFGNSIREKRFNFPPNTPNYIRYGYDAVELIWNDKNCLLVKPKNNDWNLASLKKQLKIIERICGLIAVADLERITALQRTNLIESNVAFVSGKGQVFIPSWGSYFETKILNPPIALPSMTVAAQLVYLFLYYQSTKETIRVNQTQLARSLRISKPTCTRAIQVLHSLKLISVSGEKTAKWISLAGDSKSSLNAAFSKMSSPIHKFIHLKNLPSNLSYKLSGLNALSARTLLSALPSDAGYAISREEAKKIDCNIVIDEQAFRDFGGVTVEIWKYDPFFLSESEFVDDISLLLELDKNDDERVQKELDKIRRDYGIDGGI